MRKVINQEKNTCPNIKNVNGGVLVNDDKEKDRWSVENFDELYNVGRHEAIMNMIGFGGVMRNVYKGIEPLSMQELENAVNKLKNGKAAEIDEITRGLKKNVRA